MAGQCARKYLGDKTYRCFFELALLVMGGKWKPIILYHLGVAGVLRFSELKRGMGEVTDRMLTRQLRELEADGLITRTVHRQVPPKVEYALTALGQGLFPILLSMRDWGAVYEEARGDVRAEPGGAEPLPGTCRPSLHPSYGAPKDDAAQGQ